MRPTAAFFLAPVPAAALLAPVIASDTLNHDAIQVFFILLLTLWTTQLVIAVPLRHFRARWAWRASAVSDTIVSLIATGLPALAYGSWHVGLHGRRLYGLAVISVMVFAVMGAITGLTYWFMCNRRTATVRRQESVAELRERFD